MKHPHLLHIADIGYNIFGKHWIAYELTAIALILNNVFIQGLHTLTGAEILNVLSEHGTCTVVFSVCVMLLCFLCTLPRKLEHVALMGIASASELSVQLLSSDSPTPGKTESHQHGEDRGASELSRNSDSNQQTSSHNSVLDLEMSTHKLLGLWSSSSRCRLPLKFTKTEVLNHFPKADI